MEERNSNSPSGPDEHVHSVQARSFPAPKPPSRITGIGWELGRPQAGIPTQPKRRRLRLHDLHESV